jgi:acid phosphatase type 7
MSPTVAVVMMMVASPVLAQTELEEQMITPKSEWKYNDSGADLGTTWWGIGFDDSDWSTGKAPLGYGDPGIGTEISFGENWRELARTGEGAARSEHSPLYLGVRRLA